ncbi:gustatory and odorant receptor 22 isoform X3 [Cryptotermes secundus]|uniref:gustatory and odorant receptor 22 isoform X3 n=1 Tax=Cryptotermes secundus TaxID=105785 RepID=UPI000CD7B33D|nr:gustatory and odorant receptor 22 isoform X3 [Cryptotermes secundus]
MACMILEVMQLKRIGSQLPNDRKCDLPEVTKWRHLDESSLAKDETIVAIPEAEETASEFFDELKAVIYTMKIFGLFPLQKRNPGESTFQRCKLSLVYSAVFYVAVSVYAYHVSRERIEFIRYSEASFDDLIYSVIHFLYVIPHFYLIPCHWKEVTKVGGYFARWSQFQKQFLCATEKQLYLGQNRRAKWSVVLIPVLALLFAVSEYLLSSAEEKYWELGFYWYIFTVILLHVVWWWFVCSSLRGAIYNISENFFNCHVFQKVGPEFRERLLHLTSADKQVRRELKIFIRATTISSSEINLGGYVRIDRSFLLRFTCTMVTYLIVLLQFRLGLLSISASNITMVTTSVL